MAEQQRPTEVRTAHLHLAELESTQWRNYVRFRDRLRTEPALRNEYARLKQQLAALFPTDRPAYTGGKQDFIRKVLELADGAYAASTATSDRAGFPSDDDAQAEGSSRR